MTAAVPAVVLGGGITALAVLRELAKTGVPVLAAADGDDLVAASKYFRPLPAGPLAQDEDTIEPYFRSLELERAALFPCSDFWVTKPFVHTARRGARSLLVRAGSRLPGQLPASRR
jgi:hypothetical protein